MANGCALSESILFSPDERMRETRSKLAASMDWPNPSKRYLFLPFQYSTEYCFWLQRKCNFLYWDGFSVKANYEVRKVSCHLCYVVFGCASESMSLFSFGECVCVCFRSIVRGHQLLILCHCVLSHWSHIFLKCFDCFNLQLANAFISVSVCVLLYTHTFFFIPFFFMLCIPVQFSEANEFFF